MIKNNLVIAFFIIVFSDTYIYAADKFIGIPSLHPNIGKQYDFSLERQQLWLKCESSKFSDKTLFQNKDEEIEKCDEVGYSEACEGFFSVICGNDWVDEGYTINEVKLAESDITSLKNQLSSVSSALKPQKSIKYDNANISDLNYKTPWVEGVNGYGIGEFVEFRFRAGHPRITKFIIANGYVQNRKTWKENSRVKQLKVYLNRVPFAILNLKDVYTDQTFEVQPIGYRDEYKKNSSGKYIVIPNKNPNRSSLSRIRFEIMDVYKGDKYKDTAISEIYFNGLDVY